MYNRIYKIKVMSSLKNLKNKLKGIKSSQQPTPITKSTTIPTTFVKGETETEIETLEMEESRYLLALISKSDFSGKDIQIVYNVALKLQNIIKSYIKEDKNGNN